MLKIWGQGTKPCLALSNALAKTSSENQSDMMQESDIWKLSLFTSWFPALSVGALLTAIFYFWRPLFASSVEKAIQHKLDQRLEAIKAEFRIKEENLAHLVTISY